MDVLCFMNPRDDPACMQPPGQAPQMPPTYHVGQPGMPAGALPPWGVPTPQHPPNAWLGNPYNGVQYGAAGSTSGSGTGGGVPTGATFTKGTTTTMAGTLSWESYAAKCAHFCRSIL